MSDQETVSVSNQRNPLNKALRVLREMLILPGKDYGVRELAQGTQLPVTTVHRTLSMLEQEGWVQSDAESGQYQIGLEFYRMAWAAQAKYPIRDITLRFAREIVTECNETVYLGLYDHIRMEMFFAGAVDSSHQLRYIVPLNEWLPVYAGASGLAIMAFLPEDERQRLLARVPLAPVTELTITDPEQLEHEMAQIRTRGYACSRGQRIPGAVGIAAPIWGAGSIVVGDLVLTIPEQRFDSADEAELAALLMRYTRRASTELGGQPPQ